VPVPLPDDLKTLLDGAHFAHLATLDPDGTPQASAVWVMRDGDRIVINTAEGRRKTRNMRLDPRVALSISPGDALYTNWSIQGRVVDLRTSDGWEVIDRLSNRYLGRDYPRPEGMVRVTVVIEPTRIATNG
jgi:PPOX class probable F420-dependent enzyme